MQSITPLNLNLQFPNYSTTMYAVQHDRLSRKITAVLADGATPFVPEYGTLAVVRYKKPDGTCGFYDTDEDGNDAVTWDDNVATIMLAEQALTVAGTVLCQVQFYNGDDQRLSSFTWKIIVEENACPDETITSSDYFNILTQQIASIMEVITDLPAPSTVLPQMDGTAAIGILGQFARADHVHPATPLAHFEEVGTVNLNTLTTTGWYHGTSDNTVTLTGVDAFYCLVVADGSYVKQFVVGEFGYGNALYMRYYNGTWTTKQANFTDDGKQTEQHRIVTSLSADGKSGSWVMPTSDNYTLVVLGWAEMYLLYLYNNNNVGAVSSTKLTVDGQSSRNMTFTWTPSTRTVSWASTYSLYITPIVLY